MNHLRFVFLKLNQMLWIAIIFFLLYVIPLCERTSINVFMLLAMNMWMLLVFCY